MGICTTCDAEIQGVSSEACDQVDYGNQIVKIFFQKEEGTNFDGGVGNDVNEEADWATKLVAVGDDKIVQLPNIAATMPSVEPAIEEGNDIPYGGREAIDYTVTIDGIIRYIQKETFSEVETKTFCEGSTRIWVLTNKLWLFGSEVQADADLGAGFDGAYFTANSMEIAGIGSKTKIPFNLVWTKQCMLKPVAQLPFLRTISA